MNNIPTHEPRYETKVRACVQYGKHTVALSLKRPENFTFQPGQYVWIVIPRLSQKKNIVDRRAYSIASAIDAPTLDFVIRNNQRGFPERLAALKKGNNVQIIGPLGSEFIAQKKGAIMISGGVAIAPFLSVIKSRFPGRYSLYAFYDEKRPLPDTQELLRINDKRHNSQLFAGRPTREHFASIANEPPKPIFIAGTQEFVNSVTNILTSLGIKNPLHYEENYPSEKWSRAVYTIFSSLPGREQSIMRGILRAQLKGKKREPCLNETFFFLIEQTSNQVIITDSSGKILYANAAAERLTGYSFKEMRYQTPRLWGGLSRQERYQKIWRKKKRGGTVVEELVNRHKDGTLYTALARITPIRKGKNIIMFVATEEDITRMKKVDMLKSELISLASHQLRSPLTTIGWNSEFLLSGEAGKLPHKAVDTVNDIRTTSGKMNEMVDVFLDVSRIESGAFSFSLQDVDMRRVIEDVLSEYRQKIQQKNFVATARYSKKSLIMRADKKLLRIIIQNLIENAVHYTPIGGSISIEAKRDARRITFSIQDTGIGIPRSAMKDVTTKLFRADNAKQMHKEGIGIGLYLVKKILAACGGKLTFTSQENKGTIFTISFPSAGMVRQRPSGL